LLYKNLGDSNLKVSEICLGTMIFGEQIDEKASHKILNQAFDQGINFIDTAEMYPVPQSSVTYGLSEKIIGRWLKKKSGLRNNLVLATKVAGPSRNMPWIREGLGMTANDIVSSCEKSLKRLRSEVIDLYQIHWPERHVPAFGAIYYDPKKETSETTLHDQLSALEKLVQSGKIRYIGLSNETPYGVHEFVRLAELHGMSKVVSVQNPYSLLNRSVENGLDETLHRLNVSLLAYSPLSFGVLTGKYVGNESFAASGGGRLNLYESMRKQRWARPIALRAAKKYCDLGKFNGISPTQMAIAFCLKKWQVASTIIGVSSLKQLNECLSAININLNHDLLKGIDEIRWETRDPAI
jgi:aryl-alcohol dehydrogenase-like predicted oxidoreductase